MGILIITIEAEGFKIYMSGSVLSVLDDSDHYEILTDVADLYLDKRWCTEDSNGDIHYRNAKYQINVDITTLM